MTPAFLHDAGLAISLGLSLTAFTVGVLSGARNTPWHVVTGLGWVLAGGVVFAVVRTGLAAAAFMQVVPIWMVFAAIPIATAATAALALTIDAKRARTLALFLGQVLVGLAISKSLLTAFGSAIVGIDSANVREVIWGLRFLMLTGASVAIALAAESATHWTGRLILAGVALSFTVLQSYSVSSDPAGRQYWIGYSSDPAFWPETPYAATDCRLSCEHDWAGRTLVHLESTGQTQTLGLAMPNWTIGLPQSQCPPAPSRMSLQDCDVVGSLSVADD